MQEISRIEGVERADSAVDGALAKVTVHVRAGLDLKVPIVEAIGEANVENVVVREPTLEEAYLNILR